jgi:hypothetical protein
MTRRNVAPPFLDAKIAVERRSALSDAIETVVRNAMSEGCRTEDVSIVLEEIAERQRIALTFGTQSEGVGTVH